MPGSSPPVDPLAGLLDSHIRAAMKAPRLQPVRKMMEEGTFEHLSQDRQLAHVDKALWNGKRGPELVHREAPVEMPDGTVTRIEHRMPSEATRIEINKVVLRELLRDDATSEPRTSTSFTCQAHASNAAAKAKASMPEAAGKKAAAPEHGSAGSESDSSDGPPPLVSSEEDEAPPRTGQDADRHRSSESDSD
jgi:hypothetical protein